MTKSETLKNGFDKNAECFDGLMMEARNHMDDMEERLAAIVKILDEGVDMDNLTYDFQAVNQVHRIAYCGTIPKETKPSVPTPAGPITK